MRALAFVALLIVVSCTASPPPAVPTPTPTREPGTLHVTALLDLSGARAPSGQAQRNALELWLDQPPTSSLRVRVRYVDVAGSDARLLLELRRSVVDDRADAVIVGVPVQRESPLMEAVGVAAIPVVFTLPIHEPVGTAGGAYAFALAPSPDTVARVVVGDLVDRALLQPMLLAGDESTGSVVERAALLSEMRQRGLLTPGPLNLGALDGAARFRSAAAFARSVVLTGASAPYGDQVRSLPTAVDVPRVYLGYMTETADVTNLRDHAALVTWPGSQALATLTSTPSQLQRTFIQRFTDRYGPPSTLAASAFDALALLHDAASSAPNELDGVRLRLRLQATTFAGVVTRYTFSATRHIGFDRDDLALLRWDARRGAPFIPARVGETAP